MQDMVRVEDDRFKKFQISFADKVSIRIYFYLFIQSFIECYKLAAALYMHKKIGNADAMEE